ncbi:hypothetical protein [Mycobacteroides chelonae]|jgi:hypothetical protein|uniref:hypothetical protein n=1 Tax=Mycobacteroides chelonae TaxID=1774 RepID=UPI0009947BF6|nr:hypothetical protein [Mycobacteroides chelonae]
MGVFDESTLADDDMDEFLPTVGQGSHAAQKPKPQTQPDPAAEAFSEGSSAQESPDPDKNAGTVDSTAEEPARGSGAQDRAVRKRVSAKSDESDAEGSPTAEISPTNFTKLRNLRLSEQRKNPAKARTYGQIVLDAIDNGQSELSENWQQAKVEKTPGSLFTRQPVALKRRKHSVPPAKIVLTGLSVEDAKTIDEVLVERWKAPSRSALVDEALTLYFKRRRGPVRAKKQAPTEQADASGQEQAAS